MSIYHLSVKPVQRSKGRTVTSSAAYRAGCKITDERTGLTHDYTHKKGIESATLLYPSGVNFERSTLWNNAERAEKRKDGTTGREFEVALPAELSPEKRKEVALSFGQYLVSTYGIAADVCIHAPSVKGDQRNHHAHILCTTRKITDEGLTEKSDLELSDRDRKKRGLVSRRDALKNIRTVWADLLNKALELSGVKSRVDARTLEAQGIDRAPSVHMGVVATAIERRGQRSDRVQMSTQPSTEIKAELEELEGMTHGVDAVRQGYQQWKEERDRKRQEEALKKQMEQEQRKEQERQRRAERIQEQIDRRKEDQARSRGRSR